MEKLVISIRFRYKIWNRKVIFNSIDYQYEIFENDWESFDLIKKRYTERGWFYHQFDGIPDEYTTMYIRDLEEYKETFHSSPSVVQIYENLKKHQRNNTLNQVL